MNYGIIGLFVGIIMGLTGAGGALIAIPLFMTLQHTSLKEATVLSLVAVILGTGINLMGKLRSVDARTALTLSISGAVANYFSLRIKDLVPEYAIAGLLALIGAYSLWATWSPGPSEGPRPKAGHPIKAVVVGLFLGVLTTFTGLGGGILLVPLLLKVFGKDQASALPTSLATIFLISSISFALQLGKNAGLLAPLELLYLAAGSLASFYLLKWLMKLASEEKIQTIRKLVFTGVTVYSITNVLWRTLWT